jgi:hypothetical protein
MHFQDTRNDTDTLYNEDKPGKSTNKKTNLTSEPELQHLSTKDKELHIDPNAGYNQDSAKGNSFTFGKKDGQTIDPQVAKYLPIRTSPTKEKELDLIIDEINVINALDYVTALENKVKTSPFKGNRNRITS